MWREATKELLKEGKLVVLGVVQEQHADRARLYAQWKEFDFPILQDAVTRLGLAVVPVPIFIDEHGVVRNTRPRPEQVAAFVRQRFERPKEMAAVVDREAATIESLATVASDQNSVQAYTNLGDAHLMWGEGAKSATAAIAAYESAAKLKPSADVAAALQFRLGVTHRTRYDANNQRGDGFDHAVSHWTAALAANPNQYIWRRRIQQYGPRQIKPYPFYDWVEQANEEIKARGETPIRLSAPLSGAEVASGKRQFESTAATFDNPDPKGKLFLDDEGFINLRTTVVPSRVKPGETVRVHVQFQTGKGKWNNEGQPMQVWLNAPTAGEISQSAFELPAPRTANSNEDRRVEFEYQTPRDAREPVELSGFTAYTVCVNEDGVCRFLRRNFRVVIQLQK